MTHAELERLMGKSGSENSTIVRNARDRLAQGDPELKSILWMLREGVIGQTHFQTMLAGTLRR